MTAMFMAILHGIITAGGIVITAIYIEVIFGLVMQVLVFITAVRFMLIKDLIGMLIILLITIMDITVFLSMMVGVIMADTLIIRISTSTIVITWEKSIIERQIYTEKAQEAMDWLTEVMSDQGLTIKEIVQV